LQRIIQRPAAGGRRDGPELVTAQRAWSVLIC